MGKAAVSHTPLVVLVLVLLEGFRATHIQTAIVEFSVQIS
jgi:hypothetical protein